MKNSNKIRPMKLLVSSALLILILVSGCQGPFDLATALGLDLDTLTISPNDIVVDKDSQVTFVASPNGVYQWSVVSGSGSINSASGVYTPSGDIEYVTVQAKDPQTGEFGQSRLRFEAGVDIHILTQKATLFPGDTSILYAYGGNGGAYTYALDVNNTGAGANVTGDIYTAGQNPGTDTVSVTDGTNNITTTITVLDPATTLPDIDYIFSGNVIIASIPSALGETVVGGGSFTYKNSGEASGGVDVEWAAYISTTQGLGGIVSQVDSGTAGPLPADGESVIDFDITWPNVPGIYYVVVQLSTATDVNTGNNVGWTDGLGEDLLVSYIETDVPLGGTYIPGGASILTFTIMLDPLSVTGYADVNWRAYVSTDNNLGAGDSQVSSGSVPANLFSPDQDILPTVDWPMSGDAYVILQYESADDPASPKEAVSAVFTPPDVDFGPEAGSEPPGGTVSFGTNPGHTFTIENFGADTSTGDINWIAWLSPDAIPGDAGDVQLSSGTIINPTLDTGDTVGTPLGAWNVPTGNYNLIITWTALEDLNSGNNRIDALTPYQVISSVDYQEGSLPVTHAASGLFGEEISVTFEIDNVGTAGGYDLNWTAWLSPNPTWNAGDVSIGSGTDPSGLNAGGTYAGTVTFDCPAVDADYWVIVTWSAMDDGDIGNNSMVSPAPINVDPRVVDYEVDAIGIPSDFDAAGPVTGTFDITNYLDNDESSANVFWWIYASPDNTYDPTDFLIDTGTRPGLNSGTSTPIAYNGNWPAIGDDYFLIVILEADNEAASPASEYSDGPYAVIQTDYEVTGSAFTAGVPGSPINGPTSFTIAEINGVSGNNNVSYAVYASLDNNYDSGIDTKITPPIDLEIAVAAGTSVPVILDAVYNWPTMSAEYYLIVQIEAPDDAVAANNKLVLGPVLVTNGLIDADANNDSTVSDAWGPQFGPPQGGTGLWNNLTPHLDSGELDAGEILRLNGQLNRDGVMDTYEFTAGPSLTGIRIDATWNTLDDNLDLFLWDEFNNQWTYLMLADDYEFLDMNSIIPGQRYYIGAQTYVSGPPQDLVRGLPYELRISGVLP